MSAIVLDPSVNSTNTLQRRQLNTFEISAPDIDVDWTTVVSTSLSSAIVDFCRQFDRFENNLIANVGGIDVILIRIKGTNNIIKFKVKTELVININYLISEIK